MVKRCDFDTHAQMPPHDLKDPYCEFGDGGFWLGLSLKMQIAYIGVYVVPGALSTPRGRDLGSPSVLG